MHPLVEYFRCPESHAVTPAASDVPGPLEYAQLGELAAQPLDLAGVVDSLRHERYPEAQRAVAGISTPSVTRATYYALRPLLPVGVRKHLQRFHWRGWQEIPFPRWPVDTSVDRLMRAAARAALEHDGIGEFPFIWFWPDGAPGCVMMTHDVEGPAGAAFCERLMDMDDEVGVPSSFQVVPEAPWGSNASTRQLVDRLRGRGFEVNVHDLSHDGSLFRNRERFLRHASTINARGREFGSRGFRSGAMYRRQDWLAALDIAYDMSVPNVAHLEPQRGGCCTVMPYFNGHVLELPLTTAQDYTIFHVIGEYSSALWQQQIARILEASGLVSFIAHPDYLIEPRARAVYGDLLRLLENLRAERNVWIAPPADIDAWWRERREMTLVRDGRSWGVQGAGSERARVAFARIDGDRLVYEVTPTRRAA